MLCPSRVGRQTAPFHPYKPYLVGAVYPHAPKENQKSFPSGYRPQRPAAQALPDTPLHYPAAAGCHPSSRAPMDGATSPRTKVVCTPPPEWPSHHPRCSSARSARSNSSWAEQTRQQMNHRHWSLPSDGTPPCGWHPAKSPPPNSWVS